MPTIIRLSADEIQYILDNANRRSVSEIAGWIGCTPHTVRYQMHKHGIQPQNIITFNVEQTGIIISMLHRGHSYREIADELGMSKRSVSRRVEYLRKKGIRI